MKKTGMCVLAAIVMVALAMPAAASEACKGIKVKEDKFGGGASVDVPIQLITAFTPVGMSVKLDGSDAELLLSIKESGAFNAEVPEGTEVPFLFLDGEVLQFTTCRPASSRSWADGGAVYTTVTYAFDLDAEKLQKLTDHTLESIRVPSSRGNHDWNAPKPVQKKLKSTVGCIATLVPAE